MRGASREGQLAGTRRKREEVAPQRNVLGGVGAVDGHCLGSQSTRTRSPPAKVPSTSTYDSDALSITLTELPATAVSKIVGHVSHVPPTSNESASLEAFAP